MTRKSEIQKIAAEMVRGMVSPYAEDWPKTMPKSALRKLGEVDDRLRELAWRLAQIAKGMDSK